MAKNDVYNGRLMCDGFGNLLAHEATQVAEKVLTVVDENGEAVLKDNGEPTTVTVPIFKFGENHGMPVAFEDGQYVFVKQGEPSHNERHHLQFVETQSTQDQAPDEPGYAGSPDNPNPGHEHHWGPTDDDPHYDPDAANGVRMRYHPDRVGKTVTSHTAAYTGSDNG